MKLLHDLPIRRKVMLVMMLTTGVALLLACTALLSYELREFRHKLESDLATLGQVIGANSSAAISFDDEQAATEMLAALRAEPQIVAARIYRQGGQPLAGYIRPGATATLPDAPSSTAFHVADDRLHHFAPVEDAREKGHAGTIYLAAEFGGMRDRVKSYAGLLVIVLVASGLVAFALSAKLQAYISGPILKLADTTRKVSDEGNYSLRAVRETEDEIGDLITSFNEMLAQIQHRDAELHAAHDNLERRVQERTAELQQEVAVRARAEENLARSLSLVTATLEATADGILVVDGEGAVASYNQRFASMWKIPPEVLDRGCDEDLLVFVSSQLKDPEAYTAKVKALYSDLSAPSEDIVEFLDGRVFERHSQPHRVHGLTVGRVWSFRDVTARNKAEEQIREQASLLDLAQDAILIRDLDDVVLFWNKGAERLYGWPAEEVLGSQMGKLFHKDPAKFLGAKSIVVAKNEWSGELSQFTKNGAEVIAESRWTLLRDGSGVPKSILVINTDVTERKKLEGQFLRAQRMESIGTLAGGIAHDLNNVLAPILMSIDLLRRDFTEVGADQVLDAIELSALRGADLVRQILYFARGADGKRMAVKPQRVLNEVFKIARDTFPKDISLQCHFPPDLWALWGDPTQFHQVLLNLVVNARDAMPEGGTLTISAENCTQPPSTAPGAAALGPAVLVHVSDTGMGIPEEVREKIFEPFFTTKEFGQGTGLGLSTVMAIVKSHGGSIHLETAPGKGTSFTIAFPAVPQMFEDLGQEEKPVHGNDELLLLIDDEASVRLVVKQMLEASGYRVITAPDGATALSIYAERQGEIALVITDMMMPGMDGAATIRALKQLDPHVPIIAASGMMHEERETSAAEAGALAFLWKPYTADTILRAIHKTLSAGSKPATAPLVGSGGI